MQRCTTVQAGAASYSDGPGRGDAGV
jgi:hypothetical protein